MLVDWQLGVFKAYMGMSLSIIRKMINFIQNYRFFSFPICMAGFISLVEVIEGIGCWNVYSYSPLKIKLKDFKEMAIK